MPNFAQRSEQEEMMDDLALSGDELRKNLRELETVNALLGGKSVVLGALGEVARQKGFDKRSLIRVADIGCGGGDLLRDMAFWAREAGLAISFVGFDANETMIEYAREKTAAYPEISYLQADIFSPEFQEERFDVAVCSLFCHHFTNAPLTDMIRNLLGQCGSALIINDLHRHPLAYYAIWALTRLLGGSRLIQNDAPLSVLRAFKKKELEKILREAGAGRFEIRWEWAFRYRAIVWK